MTDLAGAKLTYAKFSEPQYKPATAPAAGYLTGLEGLTTLRFDPGRSSGVAQLRAQLAAVGLRDLEREVTYAIEHNKTRHALARWRDDPLAAFLAVLRLVFIEWTTGYGLYPFFAIGLLLVSIVGFTLVYLFPLYRDGIRAIHRIWPADRLDTHSGRAKLAGEVKVERLRLRSLKKVLQYALWFSVLNAFHLGWRELNVGTWLARVQTREYTLRADGWVRTVAGVQSLLSVYLLAIWALTYFGQPFQ